MTPIMLLMVGVSLIVLFLVGVTLPLKLGVLGLAGFAVWGLIRLRLTRLSLLPRLMIILYSLPFSILLVYLVYDDYVWWNLPAAVTYIEDRVLMQQMVMVGLIGLLGLLAGLRLAMSLGRNTWAERGPLVLQRPLLRRTLDPMSFWLLLIGALLLAWIFAPTETIFAVAYATSGTAGLASKINFNASGLFAFLILVLLYIDVERGRISGRRRRWKEWSLFGTAGFIVIYFGILRGDRDGIALITALMALYLTGPTLARMARAPRSIWRRRIRRMFLPASLVVVIFVMVGAVRSQLHSRGFASIGTMELVRLGLQQSTWTSILRTNLGMAAQYRYGPMEYYFGRTYLDYVLSLPPGLITQAVGIERPLEATHGPAWWFVGLSAGGMHPAVVPFKNFGVFGVLIVLGLYGFMIGCVELANTPARFWPRLLYASVICSSFKWFWYSDMSMIRGLMIAVLLGFGYLTWLSVLAVVIRPLNERFAARGALAEGTV